MRVLLHAATIEHVRMLIAAERAVLPLHSEDVSVRGAAVISHDVFTVVEEMLAGLIAPPCALCAAKAKGEIS